MRPSSRLLARSFLAAVFLSFVSLSFAPAAFAQDRQSDDQYEQNPEKLAREGIDKLMKALGLFLESIPQYEAPVVLENGDILIRRKNPPKGPQDKGNWDNGTVDEPVPTEGEEVQI